MPAPCAALVKLLGQEKLPLLPLLLLQQQLQQQPQQ
jgi:hypothetical protein